MVNPSGKVPVAFIEAGTGTSLTVSPSSPKTNIVGSSTAIFVKLSAMKVSRVIVLSIICDIGRANSRERDAGVMSRGVNVDLES